MQCTHTTCTPTVLFDDISITDGKFWTRMTSLSPWTCKPERGITSASVSIRHKKKKPKRESAHSNGASRACGKAPASGGSARASIAPPGGAARTTSNKEEEMWSPYLVVIEEISFENVAKYLRGSDGIAWRQSNNIAHFATAQELLEW